MAFTFGDVYRPYVKPSMDGAIIIRKRNTNFSERGKESLRPIWDRFADWAKTSGPTACRGKRWKEFVACLRDQARALRK